MTLHAEPQDAERTDKVSRQHIGQYDSPRLAKKADSNVQHDSLNAEPQDTERTVKVRQPLVSMTLHADPQDVERTDKVRQPLVSITVHADPQDVERTDKVRQPLTCWTTGNISKDWKKATVVAIPKNGKPPQQTSSYRPIALTPHLGKVYERVLKNRLDHRLEKNEILPLCQAGFRKGRNCMEHVVRLIEDTKKWSLKGKNKKTVATFFDIKKAFDSVWHAKLLNKMGALGITGRMYNFIQTFLDSREMTVKGSKSTAK
ncbi:hypothetical protein ACOMHN_040640 [Nucella lapillus]